MRRQLAWIGSRAPQLVKVFIVLACAAALGLFFPIRGLALNQMNPITMAAGLFGIALGGVGVIIAVLALREGRKRSPR